MKLEQNTLDNFRLLTTGKNKGCYKKGRLIYKIMDSCKGCGKPYLADIYAVRKGKGLFCDHKCQLTGKTNPFYGRTHTKESKKKQGVNSYNNPSQIKYWLDKGLSRQEAKIRVDIHNRTNSQFCVEYWTHRGYTEEQAKQEISKIQSSNGKKVNHIDSIPTQLGYWLNKGYTEEQAKQLVSERQSTFSLKKCIEKHGEIEGKKRWKERQEKWLSNYKRFNYSKISQELFWMIYEKIKDDFNDIYFATLGKRKGKDLSGKNHEYRIDIGDSFCKADFFIKDINKIIEFDGDYCHGEARGNQKRDRERDLLLFESGYEVLHIREHEWKDNPEQILNKCKEFIYEIRTNI